MEKNKVNNYKLVLFDEYTGDIKFDTDTNSLAGMLVWKQNYKKNKDLKSYNKFLTEYFGEKVMIFQEMLDKASEELGFEELRMLTCLIAKCDFENWINISQKELAEKFKTKTSSISRAIRKLSLKGYIQILKKNNTNYYRINPEVAWKGTFENWKKVIELKPRISKKDKITDNQKI